MSTINWQHIYQDYSPKLLGICRRYIQDIYTAEDIVQDSFITAIQKNHQLNDEKALRAWLKKIVVNNALQHIRKYSKDTFTTVEPSEIPDTYSDMDYHLQEEKNVFIYDFTNEDLLSSIDRLPPHHKSVFNLYFIENHSHAEISGVLGITVNTSKSHLLRAKKSVQNYLLKNFVHQHTPKNKIVQLLVIFGFGGLLWAQTFRSKFAEFSISPSKNLGIPSDITGKTSISQKANLKKKIIIAGTILMIVLISVFLLNPGNRIFTMHHSAASSNPTDEKQGNTANKNDILSSSGSVAKSKDQNINEFYPENNKQTSTLKTQTAEEENLKSRQHLSKTTVKDSVHEIPRKVILVKKIIRRDTIFVEK